MADFGCSPRGEAEIRKALETRDVKRLGITLKALRAILRQRRRRATI